MLKLQLRAENRAKIKMTLEITIRGTEQAKDSNYIELNNDLLQALNRLKRHSTKNKTKVEITTKHLNLSELDKDLMQTLHRFL